MARAFILVAALLSTAIAHADLAAPPTGDKAAACIDDMLARFMPAAIEAHQAKVIFRPDEWPVRRGAKLDVWLPSGRLGRFAVTRIKKLWEQDGWVEEAFIALPPSVAAHVAVVAQPGALCPGRAVRDPPFPSAAEYREIGLEPVARPSHLFDLDGDGRPDAFTIEADGSPHSLFLLDRASQRWVRSETTDVS